jgi:hypothetical protein
MVELHLWRGIPPSKFLKHLQARLWEADLSRDRSNLIFNLDGDFLKAYLKWDERAQKRVVKVLRTVRWTHLVISSPSIRYERHQVPLDILFEALGSIPTLVDVACCCWLGHAEEFYGRAFRHLQRMRILGIQYNCAPSPQARLMMAGLAYHPNLQEIAIEASSRIHTELIPLVDTIPALAKIKLSFGYERPHDPHLRASTFQLVRLIKPFMLVLNEYDFTDDLWRALLLSDSITAASIRGLGLQSCHFDCALSLGHAFVGSRLKALYLSLLSFDKGSYVFHFLPALAESLPTMQELEDVDIACNDLRTVCAPPTLQLLIALKQCLSLVRIKLMIPTYSEIFDRGLADCIRNCSGLEVIELRHGRVSFERLPFMETTLFESVKSNVMIHTLALKSLQLKEWDVPLRPAIETVLRLNRSGRRYMIKGPSNARAAIRVLGQVSDDLDCLYFHIRENPLLCLREGRSIREDDECAAKDGRLRRWRHWRWLWRRRQSQSS